MARVTERVSRELRAIPGVRNFGSHIGRAEVADEVVGPNFTELWISIDPKVDYTSTVKKIQDVVDGYPGLYRDLLTYLKERIKEVLTWRKRQHRRAHLRAGHCGASRQGPRRSAKRSRTSRESPT
jgi:Cu/Ag efflux pump CusA